MYTDRPICFHAPKGLVSFCTCGFSQKKPYCDGLHKTLAPDKKSVKFECQEGQKMFVCDCGKSKTMPFCDGGHHCTPV